MSNYILYNRIMDEDTGSASYLINLPNGGMSIILGNTMMKGPNAQNRTLVDYGSEGLSNPDKQLYVVNNTMVSTRANGATFVSVSAGTGTAKIINNIFCGAGTVFSGAADTLSNLYSRYQTYFNFADTSKFEFRIYIGGQQYDSHGVNPGSTGSGFPLLLSQEYFHPTDSTTGIADPIYIGALHEGIKMSVHQNLQQLIRKASNFPNPFSEKTTLNLTNIDDPTPLTISIFNQLGNKILSKNLVPENSQIIFERGDIPSGVYYYEIGNSKGERIGTGKFIIL